MYDRRNDVSVCYLKSLKSLTLDLCIFGIYKITSLSDFWFYKVPFINGLKPSIFLEYLLI